jgi:DNA mismatch repair protein MutS2
MLQETLITQRNGRFVVPLRAEFKGRLRSIVHDQSASGATLFVEPLAVVDLNNQLRELELAERDEVLRILADLSRQVGLSAAELDGLVAALAGLDLAFARAKYAEDLKASEPLLVPIREKNDGKHSGVQLRIFRARHPLLDPASVVPIDVYLEGDTYSLVITGPNTGGKTVTLKTVGLLALMAQSGLHIPVQSGSVLSIFQAVYADIGDEQSIEQSLSTFSGHITNIIYLLERADNQSLVLLDELGAGTDPQEGSALARAILTHLLDRGITTLASTHYPELKAYAQSTPGIVNASVEFNLETLRPTFHLTIGLPGRSNALAIAERLGLPQPIIEAARSELNPEDLRVESLLDEIHRQRDLARAALEEAEQARLEAEKTREQLTRRLEKVEDERRVILDQARSEAENNTLDLQNELDGVRRALAKARQPLDALKPLERTLQKVEEQVQQPVERRSPERLRSTKGPLRLGEKVRLRSLNMEGVVTSLGESEAEIQVGMLRVRARLTDVQRSGEVPPTPEAQPPLAKKTRPAPPTTGEAHPAAQSAFHASPGMELDLRGQRVEDALIALERHIEAAYLSGLPFVRIIHGKGTGRLRQVVRQALRESSQVGSWITGQENEGGDGVTIAKMSSE